MEVKKVGRRAKKSKKVAFAPTEGEARPKSRDPQAPMGTRAAGADVGDDDDAVEEPQVTQVARSVDADADDEDGDAQEAVHNDRGSTTPQLTQAQRKPQPTQKACPGYGGGGRGRELQLALQRVRQQEALRKLRKHPPDEDDGDVDALWTCCGRSPCLC